MLITILSVVGIVLFLLNMFLTYAIIYRKGLLKGMKERNSIRRRNEETLRGLEQEVEELEVKLKIIEIKMDGVILNKDTCE